ncbi:hypothetical protein [Kutzneria sp. 744]|uniref:hypothetical protein n=1 Tax=Kutzneria sp. (strain 744) TaxID=345341 RepID=UPI0003EECB1D|nr:hypothetical protein [Kutzneria sp. 744]EWM18109.1 hypothetical protein KUTG_08413 [Kutzneria sp. 744]
MSFQQPPFDSSTVRRATARRKDAWIIGGTAVGVLAMLGLGAWAVVAITSTRGQQPQSQGGGSQAAGPVDPLAAAAAQQFTDALADDDVAAAKLVVCSSENPQAAGVKVPYEVRKLVVNGSTGTVTLVKHPQQGQDVDVPAVRLVKQDGAWKVCGTP